MLERETLLSQISELEVRNQNLVQKNAQLAGSSRIEHDAYLQANQNLVKLQRELSSQKKELVFYQGIVSPKNTAFGINLQSFEMKQKINQNQHNYKLVLTKRGESNRKLRGRVRVTIRGEDNGKVREMKLSDIKLENQNSHRHTRKPAVLILNSLLPRLIYLPCAQQHLKTRARY